MIDLEKYTHYGKFKLHSGQESDVFYDVKEMIVDNKLSFIAEELDKSIDFNHKYSYLTLVGIESAGAIIASFTAYIYDYELAIITKDDKLIGKVDNPYILVDDVCSTENSIRKAIEIIGKEPTEIWVVVDRRAIKANIGSLEVKSMFHVE